MKFDFKTAFQAAKMPALALIAVTIIIAVLGFFGLNLGIISLPIQFAILAYAGYNGVKAFKLDLVNGAAAGAIASFLSMIITVILNITLTLTGFIPLQALSAQTGMSRDTLMVFSLIGYAMGLVFSLVIGFIFGIIGAYFAKKK